MADELLTKEQVEMITQFTEGLVYGENYGYYSPMLSNSVLQNLNNNAKVPTQQNLRKALAEYKQNENNLRSYAEFCRVWDMIYARTIEMYVNTLSFDLSFTCTNAYTKADYQSDEYKEDKKRVYDFLNKFNYKNEFRKVISQVMLHETYFCWFRRQKWGNKGMKYALQILPQDRCVLTGYWEKGLLFDFDMNYFLQAGVDINAYDPEFKKYYKNVFGEAGKDYLNYRPTNQFNDRTGTFAMWTQTSPTAGSWCFKFSPENFNATPFLAPLMKMALTNDEIEQLQRNKDMAEAYAILAGEIATFDSAKSGTQANQFTINPKTLGTFMGKAKAGLIDTIKLAAMPLQGLGWHQYVDNNPDMYKNQLSTSSAVGVGAGRLLYADDRMSNVEVEASLTELYNTVKPMYYQFNNFLEFFVNQITKKYHFAFTFDGSNYPFERKNRVENLLKLADHGVVLDSTQFASTFGIEPQKFEASLLDSKYSGWVETYSQLMLNANTAVKEDNDGGRPTIDDSVNDSTEASRDQ